MINVGIIGLGFMAATHIRELQFGDVEESQLVFAEEPPTEQRP